jgi:WhiB family transcriptional regulator, redox-sensing transcriptional regulator
MNQTQPMPGIQLRAMPGNSLIPLARQAKKLDDPLPCQREDPQLWFSGLPADLELAKEHCGTCPIRGLCLAGAVERREPHGVWGGELFTSGAIIARKRPRGRPRRLMEVTTGGDLK